MAHIKQLLDNEQCEIVLDSGEVWEEGGEPLRFKDYQAAQVPFAEGRIPEANTKAQPLKAGAKEGKPNG